VQLRPSAAPLTLAGLQKTTAETAEVLHHQICS
jgi:hypothetical protein